MRLAALLILAPVFAVPSASLAQSSPAVATGQSPRKDAPSPFKPEEVVVKIGKRRIDVKDSLVHGGISIAANSGTGYCLGQYKCDFVLTNYHVAERVGSPLKIGGVKVLQTYEATSPQDEGAVWEKSPQGFSVKLVPVRDIAIFRLAHPLAGMRPIPFSPRELQEGENVKVYGYPGAKKLTTISATFYGETKDGMLVFKARTEDESLLLPGLSGSLVLNEKNEAVGLVSTGNNGFIGAVPVWSVANFVKKVQPERYAEIFSAPDEAPANWPTNTQVVPIDLVAESEALAKDIGPDAGLSPPPALPEEYLSYNLDKLTPSLPLDVRSDHTRVADPPNVQALRKNAEDMVEAINDLIAVGEQRSMGGTTPEVAVQYKLRMLSGHQTFTMDGKELPDLPCPKGNGLSPSSAWSDLPTMLGSNLKLRVQQVDDLALQGWGSVKVFRYEGTAEDKAAKIDYCTNYGLGIHTEKTISVPVRGEVWTDNDMNILRVTQELLAPPSMGWLDFRISVLYGWLESSKGQRRLVPTNMMTRAELTDDHQVYSSLCRITGYHQFAVSVAVGDQISGPII